MSDDTERSAASDGSQPVAWMTVIPLWHGGGPAVDRVFLCEREALEAKEWRDASTERGADIVPLYRSLTLTGKELEAIEAARDILREMGDDNGEPFAAEVEAISGLLERLN